MNEIENLYALIGYPLSHTFSPSYFTQKFQREGILHSKYTAMSIASIEELPAKLEAHPNLRGMNVTLPYKQQVMQYLDEIEESAAAIGAVNTIRFHNGKKKGFNTDVTGFEVSLQELLGSIEYANLKALVLGSGGASKAVNYVLGKMGIEYQLVSRNPEKGDLTYKDITPKIIENHQLIINTTPLGMSPKVDTAPDLPYDAITSKHYLYDLVYNPKETLFLKNGKNQGAAIMNGLKMLYLQAEASWEIWTLEEG